MGPERRRHAGGTTAVARTDDTRGAMDPAAQPSVDRHPTPGTEPAAGGAPPPPPAAPTPPADAHPTPATLDAYAAPAAAPTAPAKPPRGRLRIWFGAAAGVGKTYAML